MLHLFWLVVAVQILLKNKKNEIKNKQIVTFNIAFIGDIEKNEI